MFPEKKTMHAQVLSSISRRGYPAMRFNVLLVLCLSIFVSGAGAANLDIMVEGTPVHLPMPTGSCGLDTRYEVDRLIFQTLYAMQRQQSATDAFILAIHMNCEQLYSIRNGQD